MNGESFVPTVITKALGNLFISSLYPMPLECDMPLKSEAVTEKGSHSREPLWRNAWFKKRFSSFKITMRNFFLAQANKLRPSARVPLARSTLVRHQGCSVLRTAP